MKHSLTIKPGTVPAVEWLYAHDCEYYDYGSCKRHLQFIVPYKACWAENEKVPLILLIPGSAWHKQEMYNDVPKWAELAKRGYAVAAMEYRESDLVTFPDQVEDVANALRYIATVADGAHIDMERVYLMGNSSGGHIAMMAALFQAHGLCPLPRLSGVIVESGSTDLLICAQAPLPPWMKVRPSAVLLGVEQIEGNEELARKASCGAYITEDIALPPVLLIHSENDPVVSVECSRTLHDRLAAAGHSVDYYEIKNCDAHGGPVFYAPDILDLVQKFCESMDKRE